MRLRECSQRCGRIEVFSNTPMKEIILDECNIQFIYTFMVQEPLTPWHLHILVIDFFSILLPTFNSFIKDCHKAKHFRYLIVMNVKLTFCSVTILSCINKTLTKSAPKFYILWTATPLKRSPSSPFVYWVVTTATRNGSSSTGSLRLSFSKPLLKQAWLHVKP